MDLFGKKTLLKTHEISSAIIDLLEETKDRCYIITPYIKPWIQLENAFKRISEHKKKLTLVLCNNKSSNPGFSNLDFILNYNKKYKFEAYVYENIHMKVYLNDTSVILSSMNLYNSSNEKNLEIGYKFNLSPSEMKNFKTKYIFDYIFDLSPIKYLKGNFENEYSLLKEKDSIFQEEVRSKGFCTKCGKKIDYDVSSIVTPHIVRCMDCYAENPYPEQRLYRISYCHWCGKKHNSTLLEPLHKECKEKLLDYRGY